MIPDGLLFGLVVLAGAGAALSARATTDRQDRLAASCMYLLAGLCMVVGAFALAGQVPA